MACQLLLQPLKLRLQVSFAGSNFHHIPRILTERLQHLDKHPQVICSRLQNTTITQHPAGILYMVGSSQTGSWDVCRGHMWFCLA